MRSIANQVELRVGDFSDVAPPPTLRLLPGGDGAACDLRALAERAAATPTTTEPLPPLWEALVSGRQRAVDSFIDDERCSVVLRLARPDEQLPSLANARNLALLTRVLLGEPQKIIALDFKVSPSSVAGIAAQYAHAMGFHGCVSRLPVFLVMAAHAAQAAAAGEPHALARVASFSHAGTDFRVVSAARPDPARIAALSEAECEVVALLCERHANADIARLRGTSPRTIANQLGSVMHKVGARGRCEIVARLIEGALRA